MKRAWLAIPVLACSWAPLLAAPAQPSMDERVQRLERILHNQSMSDLLLRIQRLEREVQQLRGELESQAYTISALKKQQRDLYMDVDNRLGRMATPGDAGVVEGAAAGMVIGASGAAAVAPTMSPEESAPPAEVPAAAPVAEGGGDLAGEEEAYQKGTELIMQRQINEAIKAFQDFLGKYPAGRYAPNAHYWLGEAYHANGDYDSALAEFQTVIGNYPGSAKIPGALLKSGYGYQEKQDWAKARELLEQVVSQYPDSAESRLATRRLDELTKAGH